MRWEASEGAEPRFFQRPSLSMSEPHKEPPSVNGRCLFFFSSAGLKHPVGGRGEGGGRSVALAGLAAHLSEVRTTAELELQHQRAVRHFVHVFAFWWTEKERRHTL